MSRSQSAGLPGLASARLAALAGLLCAGAVLAAPSAVRAGPAPPASAGQRDELTSVFCTGPGTCMAVGEQGKVNKPVFTLAETWTAGRWRVLPTPRPAGVVGSQLLSVACLGPARCVAVGFATQTSDAVFGLVQVWNGRTWRALRLPGASSSVQMLPDGVSCLRRGCLIVGSYASGHAYPLAAWLTDSSVRMLRPPVPPHAQGAGFGGVSCVEPASCMAVGGQARGTATPALAERWNGRRWRVLATPNPPHAASSTLSQVSCVSPARCLAVGAVNYFNRTGVFARNQAWASGHWRAVQVTGRQPGNPSLSAVSCTPAFTCLAVGVTQSARAFAQTWNGTTLRPAPARQIPGIGPTAIDCTAVARCVAVGLRGGAGLAFSTAAELWNGRTWRSLAAASP